MSTRTEPGCIEATSSALTRCGAFAPGTSTAPTTRSAPTTSRSIASAELMTVWMRPCQMRSMSRSRSTARSTTVTSASIPAAICAALAPAMPRAEHDHLGRSDPGRAAHQHPSSTARAFQRGGAFLRSHASGDLRHGRQQGQASVGGLHGLVRDRLHLAIGEEPGELRVRRQVEVGEQHLATAEPLVLLRLRFLHLHDHVGLGEDRIGIGHDRRHPLPRSRHR